MTAKWGFFLCNCHQTDSIDPQRLDLPTPSVQLACHPETAIQEFTRLVNRERLDHVLISCCTTPALFQAAFTSSAVSSPPQIHFVNLHEHCFWVHPDPAQAHAKATRLIRAAVQAAEAQDKLNYKFLTAGDRILIVTDVPQGVQLAEQIRDVAHPSLVVTPGVSVVDAASPGPIYRGRVLEVKGSLGDFRVTIEDVEATERLRRELQADQVVMLFHGTPPAIKPRTGCHLVINPIEADVERLTENIHQHIGEFLKTVYVNYQEEICAGGAANQEACGRCITACPYDAISRNNHNSLRMHVDPMTCEGCGACVSACPTSALQFTEPSPPELYTQLTALLAPLPEAQRRVISSPSGDSKGERLVVLFHCSGQGRRTLEVAGQQSLPYPARVLPIEVPCLRYISEANMLAALRLGAAGVGFLGCETCQHGERELFYQKYDFCRLTLDAFALGSERLRLITADKGKESEAITALSHFAETVEATPIRWDGQHVLRHPDNRAVITEAIATFMEQLGREPGRRTFHAPHPFAFAEVQTSGCTLCRSCVNVCPVHAFRFEQNTFSLQFKHLACVACGLCETVCPERVITLRREIYFERAALDYQTVVQDEMVTCARCGKPYINKKALETVEAKILSLESLLDTFTGIRRNLLRMCPDCRAVSAMLEVEKGWEP